ncbi:hypothetical protein ACFSQ7_39585 [Paenibacillus rhizoplanae]
MMGSLLFAGAVIFVAVKLINRSNRNARYKKITAIEPALTREIIISSQVPEPMRAATTKNSPHKIHPGTDGHSGASHHQGHHHGNHSHDHHHGSHGGWDSGGHSSHGGGDFGGGGDSGGGDSGGGGGD